MKLNNMQSRSQLLSFGLAKNNRISCSIGLFGIFTSNFRISNQIILYHKASDAENTAEARPTVETAISETIVPTAESPVCRQLIPLSFLASLFASLYNAWNIIYLIINITK